MFLGQVIEHRRSGELEKYVVPPSKTVDRGGRQFQGVGAADAAMVAVAPNRLVWPNRGWGLRIPCEAGTDIAC
jgi:hypothetical protein